MKFDKSMEPNCASAKPLQRRPHLSSPLLRVISKKGTHPGYAYRIKRWHRYQVGMSVLHCRETEGFGPSRCLLLRKAWSDDAATDDPGRTSRGVTPMGRQSP